MASPPYATAFPKDWWENRWLLTATVLLMTVPLLWPQVPPLTDLPGHMGRYRVQLDGERTPSLAQAYEFRWALVGNLGVDLLVQALAPLVGLERAVKLIVLAIPPLTAAGMLFVAREVHGRLPPTVFFALPLAYGFPFQFGFINFALSMALALLGLGLWLRLGRLRRLRMRAALFVPYSLLLWLCHAFGWGTLGALALSAEAVRAWDRGSRPVTALWRGGLSVLPLTPPFLLMAVWRSGNGGDTGDFFNLGAKLQWLVMVLRDRWQAWDLFGLFLLVALIYFAARDRRLAFSRNLAASALLLALLYLLLPRIVFGSAYADMRLAPFALAVAVLAIRRSDVTTGRLATGLAIAGLLFVGGRLAGHTASFLGYDARYRAELAAIDRIAPGSAVVALVGKVCPPGWAVSRLEHIPSLALARRHAFVNDQWVMPGAQLLRVTYRRAAPFTTDPSQIVTDARCGHREWRFIDDALRAVPRGAFDYLWLIDPVAYDMRLTAGLRPVWRNGSSVLFALPGQRSNATSDTPTGSDTRPTR